MKVLIGVQISGKNNVKRIVADGAYDSNGNFRFLCQNDIEPAIMVRKNLSLSRVGGRSRTHSPSKGVVVLNNSELRDGNTIFIMDIDMAETAFSSIKRCLENVYLQSFQT